MDEPALVEDGRSGIASGYGDEERSSAMESIRMKEKAQQD